MIVPVQILENLKCSNCEELLSCGPVRITNDGSNICGRCTNLEETAILNKPYNELAKMCMFPCQYEAEGCYEKISFSSIKPHEAGCEFRRYICPVMSSGNCDWVGPRNKILEHTQEAHPDKILEHPCGMEHDVKTANEKTFLTTAFEVLFLIHVKISLKTHSIYHSVRRIGEIEDNKIFKYEIEISNDSATLIKKRKVEPQGILVMKEETSSAIKINTLMEALDGFENTKFVIAIQQSMMYIKCREIKNSDQIEVFNNICKLFFCLACLPAFNSCIHASKGCLWKGPGFLHSKLFCTFNKYCNTCKETIEELTMLDHMRKHGHVRSDSINHIFKKYWSIEKNKKKVVSISVQNMSYIFTYTKEKDVNSLNNFLLYGRSSVHITKSVLILRHPKTKFILHYIMNENYYGGEGEHAWSIALPDDKIQPFLDDSNFEIAVDIYYNE